MTITVYTGEGFDDIRDLTADVVSALIGNKAAVVGTAKPHMQVVHPTGYAGTQITQNSYAVVLEPLDVMDPFVPPAGSNPGPEHDPWRIVFHLNNWKDRTTRVGSNDVTDSKDVVSLAVYLGTPSTIEVANGQLQVGWSSTAPGVFKKPGFNGATPRDYEPNYKTKAKDLIEPVGNTGAEWSNTFDPTATNVKYNPSSLPQPYEGGYQQPATWDGPDVTTADQLFVNKWITFKSGVSYAGGSLNAGVTRAVPNSYRLVISDHGMYLGIWGPDPEEAGTGFSWLLVQRPVDKNDGLVRGLDKTTGLPYDGSQINPVTQLPYPIGNRPLFCVNSVNGKFWKFTVREHDNPVPTTRKDAAKNDRDSGAVINPHQQQSLTENGEYVITFLNNLNTSRFKYSDELDMIGTVSADVVGGGSSIDVSVYSEEQKRTYTALWSSGSYGSKMRLMVVEKLPTPNNPALSGGGGGGGGGGTGATFTISSDGAGGYTLDNIDTGGSGYTVGDTLVILGANLGGSTPAENATITVTTIGPNGEITAATISGTSTGTATFNGVGV